MLCLKLPAWAAPAFAALFVVGCVEVVHVDARGSRDAGPTQTQEESSEESEPEAEGEAVDAEVASADAAAASVGAAAAQVDGALVQTGPDAGATPMSGEPAEAEEGARATLGAQGGQLALDGVVEVVVPAAALIEDGELKAKLWAQRALPVALPGEGVGDAVELTPHGKLFDRPITIKLSYDPSALADRLAVMRLDDPSDVDWEPVAGARFEHGIAYVESTTFSYYTVVVFPEPTCANLPAATAACAGACTSLQYCGSAAACLPIAKNNLCGNTKIYAMHSGETTVDNPSADEMAAALAGLCGVTASSTSLADPAVVNACSMELLVGGGSSVVFAGGPFTNPALRYLDRRYSPVFLDFDPASQQQQFKTRSGDVLLQFAFNAVTPSHDFFLIQLFSDPARGALVVSAFGREGPGTRAATYYFNNVVLPTLRDNTRSWGSYVIVEWTDSGDMIANAADTYLVRVSDPLPPPPPTTETPYQSNAAGTLATGQSVNAAAGYKFTPSVDGKVTALGGYFSGTKTVKLFKGSTLLASASVTASNNWSYKDITPVALSAGTQYTVAVYLAGSGGAKRTSGPTLPQTYGNIRIDAPTQASTSLFTPNSVPTTSSSPTTTMLGLADIKFIRN